MTTSSRLPDVPALPCDPEGAPVFREPWEAQAFAMTLRLHEAGHFTWAEWAERLAREIGRARADGDPDLGTTYYAHWLRALEGLVTDKGLVSAAELVERRAEWDAAAHATPHGRPIELRLGVVERLAARMHELCDALPFHTGWYLRDLGSGLTAHRHGAVAVPSASTRKISILMAALRAAHRGRLRLDQPVTIDARYQDNDSGTFQHLTPGFTITLRDALVMMIIVSDNTCTGHVTDLVGLDDLNEFCRAAGLTATVHRYGIPPRLGPEHALDLVTTTTPADTGHLLERLLAGAAEPADAARLGVTPEHCRLALDILCWQKLRSRLPSQLPLGTKVAHKTGTGSRGYMDAGIVYDGERPLFVLTAYTDRVPAELPDGTPGFTAANQLIGQLARAAWDALRA